MAFDIAKLQARASRRKGNGIKAMEGKQASVPEESQKLDFSKSFDVPSSRASKGYANIKSLMEADGDSERPASESQGSGWFSSILSRLSMGTRVLTKQDLSPALKELKDKLMIRNIAENVAGELCKSVETCLVDTSLPTLSSMSSAVYNAMEAKLTQVFNSKQRVDVMAEILANKSLQTRPYVILFAGVNGVGKTTNLAKVAYWLGHKGLSIMIAGCDTFRSGAIEQLAVHVNKLSEEHGLDICMPARVQKGGGMQREYGRSILAVAKEAIAEGVQAKKDVVLIDTAGRMQNNGDLMNELGNLVNATNPDLMLLVSEAIAGSDAVNQVKGFKTKVFERSTSKRTKAGILLTKFDTVDDKVGAAVSMTYNSDVPLLFLGCGQDYHELKKPKPQAFVKVLLA